MYRKYLSSKQNLTEHTTSVALSGLFLIALGFLGLDQRIELFFQQTALQNVYYYSREITNIGYASHYFAITVVLFLVSHFFAQHIPALRLRPALTKQIADGSSFALKCLVATGIVVQLMKMIVGRQRPHLSDDLAHLEFEPFNVHWHWHSFPSGHTQVMLTVGTILSLIWPQFRWIFLALTAALAFTRVIIHQHFFSDYIAGILIGYIVTLWVYWKWPPQALRYRL